MESGGTFKKDWTMKKLIIVLSIFFFSGIALADQYTFSWDMSTGNVEGYKLFQRIYGSTYDYSNPIWQGADLTCTLVVEPGSYCYVVRAYDGDIQSGDSNEICYLASPTNLYIEEIR